MQHLRWPSWVVQWQEEEQVRQALDEVASRVAGAAPPGLFQREAESVGNARHAAGGSA